MFVANYGLKHLVQKAAMVARLPLGYAQAHPYTGLQERAHRETLDFILEEMPDAIAFDTPRELMKFALSRVRLEGLVCEFKGEGTVWVQSRNVGSLVSWLSRLG